MNIKTKLRTVTALALLAVCSCKQEDRQHTEEKTEYTPASEFVTVTNRNGMIYMFRPHMVEQIISETNGCRVFVAGIGGIQMGCTIDQAAKLVKAR